MSHRFDYPTAAAPTLSLVFTLTSERLVDDVDTLTFNDAYSETLGGTDRVCEYGDPKDEYDFVALVWRTHSTAPDLDDLKTFLRTVRRINTFQWTNGNGTVRTVRNITQSITFEPYGGLYIKAALKLKAQS